MRVHVVLPIASNEWPFVRALKARLPNATIDCGAWPTLKRRSRTTLIWFNVRLTIFAYRSVARALTVAPSAEAVLVNSDAELIGAKIASLLKGIRVPIILHGFIYTPRKARALRLLRRWFYRLVLSQARAVICYSEAESKDYAKHFGAKTTQFVKVLYGINVIDDETIPSLSQGYVFSAGRSGRDYHTLAEAARMLNLPIKIACDAEAPLRGIDFPSHIELLRDCHGSDYFRFLKQAEVVVIPLQDDSISAGQMVLLQAMALGKAIIISRTRTTVEYARHLSNAYLVDKFDSKELGSAIKLLHSNEALRKQLGANARSHFAAQHSIEAFAEHIAAAVEMSLREGSARRITAGKAPAEHSSER